MMRYGAPLHLMEIVGWSNTTRWSEDTGYGWERKLWRWFESWLVGEWCCAGWSECPVGPAMPRSSQLSSIHSLSNCCSVSVAITHNQIINSRDPAPTQLSQRRDLSETTPVLRTLITITSSNQRTKHECINTSRSLHIAIFSQDS